VLIFGITTIYDGDEVSNFDSPMASLFALLH
jgi:hypothetical protein